MKKTFLKVKNKADQVTYYLWEVDAGFIVFYIGIIALICLTLHLFGRDWDGLVCVVLGTLAGKAVGYRGRIWKETRAKAKAQAKE